MIKTLVEIYNDRGEFHNCAIINAPEDSDEAIAILSDRWSNFRRACNFCALSNEASLGTDKLMDPVPFRQLADEHNLRRIIFRNGAWMESIQ